MSHPLAGILGALVVILVAAKILGAVFKWIHQPPVMGEVIAGIALGPSLLGYIAPDVMMRVFPTSLIPLLDIIAQIGIILFMFLIGLELDSQVIRRKAKESMIISNASIFVPFVCGVALSYPLFPRFGLPQQSFHTFALFIGVAMSITAFPVLARILTDLQATRTPMGAIVLASAAVGDVMAWCLLALVTSFAHANLSSAFITLGLTIIFIVFMLTAGRQGVTFLLRKVKREGFDQKTMVLLIIGILLAAIVTDAVGIHPLFGPFLLGFLIPPDSIIAKEAWSRLENLIVILFLPVFFATTGLKTQITLMNRPEHWLWCVVIILVASIGKIGGAGLSAKFTGFSWRDSGAIGILMNTRGLMELIVLNLGLELGILSPAIFAMFVVMAIVTTLMTTPLYVLVSRKGS